MMTVILAIASGLGMGYIFERGDFCFHSTWRGLVRQPRQVDLLRAYLLTLLIAIPLIQGMTALGLIDPWVPPFAWQASLSGGLIFGLGMAIASTCVTGLFYKLGHGMLGVLVGMLFWGIGDVLTYMGPLSGLRESLNRAEIRGSNFNATILNLFGMGGMIFLILFMVGVVVYLARAPRNGRDKLWDWVTLGAVTGLFTSFVWLLADLGGSNYTFGTSGVPTNLYLALTDRYHTVSWWIPAALISLIPGAFIAAWYSGTLWVRGEDGRRYAELAVGGLLMGVGAGIAGGCNLGHSLVGVPLLSLGSIAATLAMAVGVWIGHFALQRLFPS